MMQLMTALAISIVVGALAALVVWLVWSFVENLQAMKQAQPSAGESPSEETPAVSDAKEKTGVKPDRK